MSFLFASGGRLPETQSRAPRRWTVIASGLLLFAVAMIVIYSGATAFHSPVAVVVMAAIGLVAVLLQVRLRRSAHRNIRIPQWLNVIGILCALGALFADRLRLGSNFAQVIALAAVGCFGVSSVIILDGLRRGRATK
jgi:drug/metabolite transporter (DMT)-like permease